MAAGPSVPGSMLMPVLAQEAEALEGAAGRLLAELQPPHVVHGGEADLGMHLAKAPVARREGRDVPDPVSECVSLGRDAAALAERGVEALLLRDREDGAAADDRLREHVGFARAVADRDVDRDSLHVRELGERRGDAVDQPRLAKAAVDQHHGYPAALAPVDSRYEVCHGVSLPTDCGWAATWPAASHGERSRAWRP